nr:gastrula zinc finger protein XlCGF57.1-like [Onthophagus taurus]
MDSRCRLCGSIRGDLTLALDDVELTTRIEKLFQVMITIEDNLPLTICDSCKDVVNTTWEFHAQVQRTQQMLLEALNTTTVINCEVKPVEIEFLAISENLPGEVEEIKLKKSKCKAESESDTLSDLEDFEKNEDGSITPLNTVKGWGEYPWQCYTCATGLSSADEIREHFATVHGQPPRYACADCPKVYFKYSIFIAHAKVHRNYLKFCCDICNKWFSSAKQQDSHRLEHGDDRPHGCSTCGKRFRMQSALLVHARSHLPTDLKNCYQCDQCPKRFGTRPNLMVHKRIHTGVRDYTCDQCGKSFVQKGNLDNHLLTHTAARPYACTTCGKAFKTLVRLRKHGSVHSGLKPHRCDVCGRQFRERGTLKEHVRIHTGAMPFTCEFCGKSFRFKGVLTTHRRQHTGERPYSCLECQHHFTNWPNYNKHMKRRHGINTSVTVRKPQSIPPTGMPQRNPPGSVLAPPQLPEPVVDQTTTYYPVLGVYNLPEELLQQRL